eukprot:COSAG04_NODE_418_length_14698_cov_5.217412_8_plen_77_part_00
MFFVGPMACAASGGACFGTKAASMALPPARLGLDLGSGSGYEPEPEPPKPESSKPEREEMATPLAKADFDPRRGAI